MDFLIEIDQKINKIFRYYELYGAKDYIGEPVTQTSHMIQAAMMAEKDGKPKTVILAALLHDIGHLIGFDDDINLETMGNVGIKNHERIGGAFLRHLDIPYPIPELVEGHVKAKRYLTHINPEYLNNNYHFFFLFIFFKSRSSQKNVSVPPTIIHLYRLAPAAADTIGSSVVRIRTLISLSFTQSRLLTM